MRKNVIKYLFLNLFVLFTSIVSAEEEVIKLTNKEGKTIEGILRAKDETSATIEIKKRNFQLFFDKLSDESVALIKESTPIIAISQRFRIDVDIKKKGNTQRSASQKKVPSPNGGFNTEVSTSSVRINKLSGDITISNRHNSLATAPVELKFVMLSRKKSQISLTNRLTVKIQALEPMKETKVSIPPIIFTGKAKTTGTSYKDNNYDYNNNSGKSYYGYICAIYQDGKIIECKANPTSYERDLESAEILLTPQPKPNSRYTTR